jgi:hypothetical protein
MNASTDPVQPEFVEEPIHFVAPLDVALPAAFGAQRRDLYAEIELQTRRERTERLIRRAQELV